MGDVGTCSSRENDRGAGEHEHTRVKNQQPVFMVRYSMGKFGHCRIATQL